MKAQHNPKLEHIYQDLEFMSQTIEGLQAKIKRLEYLCDIQQKLYKEQQKVIDAHHDTLLSLFEDEDEPGVS
jgi:hypothetical protein